MISSNQSTHVDIQDEVQMRRILQKHTNKTDEHDKALETNNTNIATINTTITEIQNSISTLEGAGYTANPPQTDPTDLNQTISASYVQAEVQAISDKVDEILQVLRNSNILS